jgi:ATP-binding cassette subfamily F protein 2
MVNSWTEKKRKQEEFAVNKMLDSGGDGIDFEGTAAADVRDAAMGKGDDELFEKKLSKEEKKALAKAKRDAKKKVSHENGLVFTILLIFYPQQLNTEKSLIKAKGKTSKPKKEEEKKDDDMPLGFENMTLKEKKRIKDLDDLSKNDIQVTFEANSSKLRKFSENIVGDNCIFRAILTLVYSASQMQMQEILT